MVYSTQQAINIAGIKDGVVITKTGTYLLILQVATTNFSLKSEQEQNSIIFQYQSFLNSLHFPVEIVIRSKRLDLTNYLQKVKKLAIDQTNDLIKMQTEDYVDFVGKLVNLANIMKKTFFAVVSYNPISVKQASMFDKLFGNKAQIFDHIKISDEEFRNCTEKLRERANIVASGLGGMGLHCFQLGTEEIIELFYQIFNPEESSKERVTDASALASSVIESETEKNNLEETAGKEEDTEVSSDAGMIDNTAMIQEKQRQETEIRAVQAQAQAQTQQTAASPQAAPAQTQATPEQPPSQAQDNTENQAQQS